LSLVIDASLTLAWYFSDEATPATEALLDRVAANGAVVPMLWRLEVANAFQSAVRRKRIDTAYRDAALTTLGRLAITIDDETVAQAWTTTLQLSERYGLTVYDAAYLELAQRRNLPLGTLDRELRQAGAATAVPILGLA
jgi:predicted nucleic acid-binding protein